MSDLLGSILAVLLILVLMFFTKTLIFEDSQIAQELSRGTQPVVESNP